MKIYLANSFQRFMKDSWNYYIRFFYFLYIRIQYTFISFTEIKKNKYVQTDEKIKTQNLNNIYFEKIKISFRKEQQYSINIYFPDNLEYI